MQTLAVLFCACIVGSCYANYGGYGQERSSGSSGAASAASSAASSGNEGRGHERYERPVEIIAGGPRGGYGHNHEILRPINIGSYGHGHGRRGPSYGGNSYNRGYGPRWTVQPAGATLLYPGQNNYRAYVSPPEYSKVVLPVRAAEPVAKLYVPEHGYGQEYRERPYGGHRAGY
ncbi:hypothetical protein KR038_011790 [Drosophila bunnanda]|nr:hypothetical protein KR038_011790 [Drosophila bunnanda]